MNAPLLRHVSAPPRMLYAAPRLLLLEMVAGIVVGAALLNPLAAVALWVITHPLAVLWSIKEPHADAYVAAWGSYRRVRNHWKAQERIYVA